MSNLNIINPKGLVIRAKQISNFHQSTVKNVALKTRCRRH